MSGCRTRSDPRKEMERPMDKKLVTKIVVFLSIVAVLLTADLAVKHIVFTTLAGKPDVVVIPGFWSFHYIGNDDIGFSLLRFLDPIIPQLAKRIFIIVFQFLGVGVAAWFFFSPKNYLGSWLKRLPLALIAAGGMGNAIDRIIRGFVVDYVLWYVKGFSWPIFNLADTYTVVGVIVLIVFLLFTKEEKKPAVVPTDTDKDEPPKE
jgi:signal peptidase II